MRHVILAIPDEGKWISNLFLDILHDLNIGTWKSEYVSQFINRTVEQAARIALSKLNKQTQEKIVHTFVHDVMLAANNNAIIERLTQRLTTFHRLDIIDTPYYHQINLLKKCELFIDARTVQHFGKIVSINNQPVVLKRKILLEYLTDKFKPPLNTYHNTTETSNINTLTTMLERMNHE